MLQGNNNWVYNKKAELGKERRKKEIEEDVAEQLRKWKLEKRQDKEWNKLDKAFKVIWNNIIKDEFNQGKLIYGNLVVEDLRKYGNNYPSTLCVESHSLSKQYNNLAMVHEYHQSKFRPYIGQKVGIKIIYNIKESLIGDEEQQFFPKCIIFWMGGKTKEELSNIREHGLSFTKGMDLDYPW